MDRSGGARCALPDAAFQGVHEGVPGADSRPAPPSHLRGRQNARSVGRATANEATSEGSTRAPSLRTPADSRTQVLRPRFSDPGSQTQVLKPDPQAFG